MSFRWIGPTRVTRVICDNVYEVSEIIDGTSENVHAARLLLFKAHMDVKTVSNELLSQAAHIETTLEIADKLLQIGEADDGLLIQIQLLGQPDKVYWTSQPLQALFDDVPDKVLSLLRTSKRTRLARKALTELGIPD